MNIISKKINFIFIVLSTMLIFPESGRGSVIVRTYNFSAINFFGQRNIDNTPNNFVTGSFTLTFDDQSETFFQDFNIVTNNLSIPSESITSFVYSPFGNGSFLIGGSLSSPNVISTGTDDFLLSFDNALTEIPTFSSFVYARNGFQDGYESTTGAVTTGDRLPIIPEPDVWVMLIVGFVTAGMSIRFRKKAASKYILR